MMTTYVLTYRKNTCAIASFVYQHELIQEVQRKRLELNKDPKYRNGKFEIRTLEGFKAKNVLKESE
jgi:hypothetical protein